MGTFIFKWPHADATEVYVTGTFDDWSKSEKLTQRGDSFEKEVTLSDASQKIFYKFVVDGNWTIDPDAPQEKDGHNNVNNILKPEDIKKPESSSGAGIAAGVAGGAGVGGMAAALLSNVLPSSTTAKLAGQVPKETDKADPTAGEPSHDGPPPERASSPPGAFPPTPAQEPDSFSVNPIPASQGPGNPVSVRPGEKLPDLDAVTGNTVDSKVTTSKEDYEKVATSTAPGEKQFSVDPIPASAGIGNPVSVPAGESVKQHKDISPEAINANATTSKEAYEKAGSAAMPVGTAFDGGADTKASAFSVPDRTKNMIPESSLPMFGKTKDTTDKGPFIQSAGAGTTTAALAGQVPLEQQPGEAKSTTADKGPFIQSAGTGTTTAALAGQVPLEQQPGEAKSTTDKGPFMQSSGAGTTTAAMAGQVPVEPTSKPGITEDESPSATVSGPTPDVPEVVQESMAKSNVEPPTAAASPHAVGDKKEVEPTEAAGEAVPLSAAGPAATSTDSTEAAAAAEPVKDSSTPPSSSSPTATTGVAESKTSAVDTPAKEQASSTPTTTQKPSSTTPNSSVASSPVATTGGATASATDKSSKRRSFFGKLKDKLKG